MNQRALWVATKRVRNLLAQSKNPRTAMGRHSATAVAFHVAYEAVRIYLEEEDRRRVRG